MALVFNLVCIYALWHAGLYEVALLGLIFLGFALTLERKY